MRGPEEERRDPGKTDGFRVVAKGVGQLGPPWSFASLIDPITPQAFCAERWGRRPLHIARGGGDFYRGLISLADIERYLSMDELFTRHSVTTPSLGYGPPAPPPASLSELQDRLIAGDSLRLRRMECFMDPGSPVLSLLRHMELALQHPRDSLSCYVAPPNARGLGPHHDETEIFTLQISGAKRWQIFHRVDTDQPGIHEPEKLGEATHDFVLEPGDLLYLPRGYVHDVTNEAASFSLTIVFSPFKWSAMLDLLVARLARTTPFMEPLPAGVLLGHDRPDSLRHELESRAALIREALADLSLDALLHDLAAKHVGRMTLPPHSRLEGLFRLDEMTLETQLERRPGVACHLTRSGDTLVLTLPGGYTLQASARAEPAFRHALAAEGPFHVSEMHDSLSAPAKLMIAKKLVGCGLLSIIASVAGERGPGASASGDAT